jgi:hypothetical protein
MENTLNQEVVIGWYNWNDGNTNPAYAKTYKISGGGHQRIDAYQNVVIQIDVFNTDKKPLLKGTWRRFYAATRNMKIVQNNGNISIVYNDVNLSD